MFSTKKLFTFLFLAFLSLLLIKCKVKKEDFENFKLPTYSPEWGLSLVKSDVYLKKFLDRSDTKLRFTEENGVIVLNYYDTLQIFEASQLMTFKENYSVYKATELSSAMVSVINAAPVGTTAEPAVTLNDTVSIKTDASMKYSRLKIRSGLMDLTAVTKLKHDISFTVVFDGIKKNGVPLSRDVKIPAGNSIANIDLSGYEIKPNANTTGIPYHLEKFKITKLNNPTSTNDSLGIQLNLKNIIGEELDVDKLDLQVLSQVQTDTIHINLFDNVVNAKNVKFNRPVVEIKALNTLPIEMSLNVEAINLLYANRPTAIVHKAGVTSGTQKLSPLIIKSFRDSSYNLEGVQVSQPLEGAPNKLAVSLGKASISSGKETVKYGQKIKLYVSAKLPLDGFITELTIADTTVQDGFPKNNVVERVNISIYTNNNYPIDIKWKVTFLDSSNKSLYTMPKVTEEPYLVKALEQNHLQSLTITKEEYAAFNIESTKKIKYEGVLNTSPLNKSISINTSQFCNIQIVGKVKGNFDLNNTDDNFNK